jgi:hypothetical protein
MWVALTENDIATGLTGPEFNAAKTAALKPGQPDPIAEVIVEITREVRARVAACNANTLGPAGTIPDECKRHAIAIAVFCLGKRLPRAVLLDEDRRHANNQAVAFLRDVAECKVALEQPETPSDEVVTSSPPPRWKGRRRRYRYGQEDGA